MENHQYSKSSIKDVKKRIGKEVEIKASVVGVKASGEYWVGIVKDDTGIITCVGKTPLAENHKYIIKGKVYKKNNGVQISVDDTVKLGRCESKSKNTPKKIEFLYENMKALEKDVLDMAQHFIDIASSADHIVVKYDNDADGLCGALIIYRMFKCLGREVSFAQNKSPIYTVEDAILDAAHYNNAHYIFIDYANNVESDEGLKLLSPHAASISIIDHHLSEREKGDELVVTPVWHGLGAEYTSGYLCYEIARRVCETDYSKLWVVSLYCDKSTLEFEHSKEIEEIGLVLDYLATTMKREKRSIRFINKIVNNEEMRHTIYLTALDKVNSIVHIAKSIAKNKILKNGISIVTVDLDKVVEQNQFPPKGKVIGKVHDSFDENKTENEPIISLGYGSNSVLIRANKNALNKGFNANNMIQNMKKEYGNVIIAGGGHPGAAAVRFRKGFKRVILNALLEKIANIGVNE